MTSRNLLLNNKRECESEKQPLGPDYKYSKIDQLYLTRLSSLECSFHSVLVRRRTRPAALMSAWSFPKYLSVLNDQYNIPIIQLLSPSTYFSTSWSTDPPHEGKSSLFLTKASIDCLQSVLARLAASSTLIPCSLMSTLSRLCVSPLACSRLYEKMSWPFITNEVCIIRIRLTFDHETRSFAALSRVRIIGCFITSSGRLRLYASDRQSMSWKEAILPNTNTQS